MSQHKTWTESQIKGIFEALGLENNDLRNQFASTQIVEKQLSQKQIFIPRLSNSSVPPPTGKITNANMENSAK